MAMSTSTVDRSKIPGRECTFCFGSSDEKLHEKYNSWIGHTGPGKKYVHFQHRHCLIQWSGTRNIQKIKCIDCTLPIDFHPTGKDVVGLFVEENKRVFTEIAAVTAALGLSCIHEGAPEAVSVVASVLLFGILPSLAEETFSGTGITSAIAMANGGLLAIRELGSQTGFPAAGRLVGRIIYYFGVSCFFESKLKKIKFSSLVVTSGLIYALASSDYINIEPFSNPTIAAGKVVLGAAIVRKVAEKGINSLVDWLYR